MSRFAARVSIEEFENLWAKKCAERELSPKWFGREHVDIGKIDSDLSKVNFDFENSESFPTQQTEDGLTMFEDSAGGDWERSVRFVVYLDKDKKTFRGYIPKAGNAWNYTTKEALGNDEEADAKFLKKWAKANGQDFDEDHEWASDDGGMMVDDGLRLKEIREHIKVYDGEESNDGWLKEPNEVGLWYVMEDEKMTVVGVKLRNNNGEFCANGIGIDINYRIEDFNGPWKKVNFPKFPK